MNCKWCGGKGNINLKSEGYYHSQCYEIKKLCDEQRKQAEQKIKNQPKQKDFQKDYRKPIYHRSAHGRSYEKSSKTYNEYKSQSEEIIARLNTKYGVPKI